MSTNITFVSTTLHIELITTEWAFIRVTQVRILGVGNKPMYTTLDSYLFPWLSLQT